MILPLSEVADRTNVSEKTILNLLKDIRFNLNIEKSMKNDRVTGVDIYAFIRNLKGDYFKQKFGYAQPNELPAIIKSQYPTAQISSGALMAELGVLAKGSLQTLDVSTKTDGARYRMFHVADTLVALKQYINERTPGYKAPAKAKKTNKVVDLTASQAAEIALLKKEIADIKLQLSGKSQAVQQTVEKFLSEKSSNNNNVQN